MLVGSDSSDGKIPPHLDNDDHINDSVSVSGENIIGGGIQYYTVTSKCDRGVPVLTITFQHGKFQINQFDSFFHFSSVWSGGKRDTFNFSVKTID